VNVENKVKDIITNNKSVLLAWIKLRILTKSGGLLGFRHV